MSLRLCSIPDCKTELSAHNPGDTCWEHTPAAPQELPQRAAQIVAKRKAPYVASPPVAAFVDAWAYTEILREVAAFVRRTPVEVAASVGISKHTAWALLRGEQKQIAESTATAISRLIPLLPSEAS